MSDQPDSVGRPVMGHVPDHEGAAHLLTCDDVLAAQMECAARVGATVGNHSLTLESLRAGSQERPRPGDVSQRNLHSERLVEDWLASLSTATEQTYRRVLEEFIAWARPLEVELLSARRPDIDRYRKWLRNPHRAAGVSAETTVAKKLSALSSFYRYVIRESDGATLTASPVANVARPRIANITHREGLSLNEAKAMLALSRQRKPMHATLAHLLLSTGMRVSEACMVNVASLGRDGDTRVVTVVRKGGKRARLPLSPDCCDVVDSYLDGLVDRSGPLLRTSRGRLSRYEAYRIIAELGHMVAPDKTIGPHSCRHTAATLAIEAGAPLWRVQEMLDHSDLRTTMRYFHASDSLTGSAVHVLADVLADNEKDGTCSS